MEEVHLTTIKPKNNVLLLAQEISFAKVLACNDKRLRDRGVRRLKKWFMARSQGSMEFTKDDFMRIWKGLFYCMWMSDKPLVQEDLAEEISKLIHSFATFKASLLFIETFFSSLSIEWFGIDQLRLDKYLMLVRRFMRQSLELVARSGWREAEVKQVAEVYHQTLASAPMGLSMHIIEVFSEELAKVGKGELSSATILQFITVFARIMAGLKDGRMISQITKYVFLHLIRQTELGVEHHMKEHAWKQCGFPGGNLDTAEKIEVDSDDEEIEEEIDEEDEEWRDDEENEEAVDARAGRVDVLLPPLDFEVKDLLVVLQELRNKKETTTKARKTLIQLISKYENLATGKYPLGLHKVDLPSKVDKKKEIAQAAKRLLLEEEKLRREEDGDNEMKTSKKINKMEALKEKKSVWEVSEMNESSDNCAQDANSSWEVSEANELKEKPSHKKRKLIQEDTQSTTSPAKKLKNSEFSISKSKNKNISNTNTPKMKNKQRTSSEFSVSESKKSSPVTPVEKASKKKKLKDSDNLTTENVSLPSDDKSTPVPKKQGKKKFGKNLKQLDTTYEATLKEIQSPEIDSTTSVADCASSEDKTTTENTTLQLNVATSNKNNGWGGEWEEPSHDTEYEIFIPNKKYVEKRKSLGLPYPVSSFVQKSAEKVTPVNRLKRELQNKSATPGSQKKVEFNLSANRAQEYKEYAKKLRSKSQIAFDASKKPVQGLLKNSTPSPINPFYKKKLKFLKTSPSSC